MNEGVARRYARAVFGLALDRGDLNGWQSDLRRMALVMDRPEVVAVLRDPKLPAESKRTLVSDAFPGMDALRLNLVSVLIAKGRLRALPAIVVEFDRLLDEHRGIAVAEVTTAIPLPEAEAQAVSRRLSALTGKTIALRNKVDPAIIGGLVARIGDRLIDGSLAGQLAALREQLAPDGRTAR